MKYNGTFEHFMFTVGVFISSYLLQYLGSGGNKSISLVLTVFQINLIFKISYLNS